MPADLLRPALRALALLLALVPAAGARAQDEGYRLRPGDVLRIEVIEDAGLNRAVLVAPDGRISLPLAGSVQAGGRTVDAVQADLPGGLAGSCAAPPTVTVSIERLAERAAATAAAAAATIAVYVMGEANRPGKLELTPGTTVLQAFAQMGGFTRFAATRRIQLRRGDRIYALDYRAIEAGQSDAGGTVLAAGDVIVVPGRRLFE